MGTKTLDIVGHACCDALYAREATRVPGLCFVPYSHYRGSALDLPAAGGCPGAHLQSKAAESGCTCARYWLPSRPCNQFALAIGGAGLALWPGVPIRRPSAFRPPSRPSVL